MGKFLIVLTKIVLYLKEKKENLPKKIAFSFRYTFVHFFLSESYLNDFYFGEEG